MNTPSRRAIVGAIGGMLTLGVAAPVAADADEPLPLRFAEFYTPTTTPLSLELSERILEASGRRIAISGYIAPPLKPDIDFFVLTRRRLAVCPFCSSAADWPEDILLVTLPAGMEMRNAPTAAVRVTGTLEVGEAIDESTGFFSLLRLRAERVDLVQA
jgi:hypothetical protein